jgi:heme exporter protein D
MRRYSREEEERIRALRMVREWTRSGLLDPAQGARLESELQVELRRTNPFLRGVLALFTGLIVTACVALIMVLLEAHDEVPMAAITGLAALACIGLADYLVLALRVYRFGVEEALAVAAVVLLGISGAALTSWLHLGLRGLPEIAAALIGAAGGLGLYLRFGFVYAALGAMVCVAAVPFQLDLSRAVERLLAAVAIAFVFTIARSKRLHYGDDYPGDEYGWLQAAAFAGVYLAVNLQLPWGWVGDHGLFYWSTYAVIWVLPLVGLVLSVRERDRALMDVCLVLALVTLLTNKAYLGWPRHTWDPIVLGLVLIAIAIAVRRWLASGPGGERHGFTSSRLLEKDRAVLSLVGTASSVIAQPGVDRSRTDSTEPAFRGGRSGGGGGSGNF